MKIQRKESVEILEVEAETEHWFVSRSGLTYSKDDYEKVVEPQWKNVTRNILVKEPYSMKGHFTPGGVFHIETRIANLVCDGTYRLRIDREKTCAYIEKKV